MHNKASTARESRDSKHSFSVHRSTDDSYQPLTQEDAVVNQSEGENCLLVGIPAKKKRDEATWMKDLYRERYEACEELRRKLFENT